MIYLLLNIIITHIIIIVISSKHSHHIVYRQSVKDIMDFVLGYVGITKNVSFERDNTYILCIKLN